MKNCLALAASVAAIVAVAPVHAATTVNFDQSTDTTTYTAQGLVLTGFTILPDTFGGAVDVPSTPNYASANIGGSSISFIDPATGVATTSNGFGLTIAGLNLGGGYFAGATATFLGLGNTVLGTQSWAPVGPNEFRSQVTYANNFAGIASVLFTRIENENGPALFPIDDVTFSLNPAAAAVPEPATWAFMIVGFGAVGGMMRRRNREVTTSISYA